MTGDPRLPDSIALIQRDWLSSNHILFVDGSGSDARATLVDSGYPKHAMTTVSLVREALGRRGLGSGDLRLLINTHLHSDHCGGNAAVARAFGCPIEIPAGEFARPTGLADGRPTWTASDAHAEPFTARGAVVPGERRMLGGAEWHVHAAPGHDPCSVILHCPEHRILISADALWENGFGLIFPELEGASGFPEQRQVLDLIESLDAEIVLPGHGPAFSDVAGALARARQRLAALLEDPRRNARNGLRVMVKYTMLDLGRVRFEDLVERFRGSAILEGAARTLGLDLDAALDWAVADLCRQGEIERADEWILDKEADHAPDE